MASYLVLVVDGLASHEGSRMGDSRLDRTQTRDTEITVYLVNTIYKGPSRGRGHDPRR